MWYGMVWYGMASMEVKYGSVACKAIGISFRSSWAGVNM